jgi:hypothetical protein
VDRGFGAYVARAVGLLAANRSREAQCTLDAIRSGQVRIGPLAALTPADYRRVRRDLNRWHIRLPESRASAVQAIARSLNGYMWSNRVYVHPQLSPRLLAATLVHEISHVLNASQGHYRGAKDVLREEYRAFYAEKRFAGVRMTRSRCRALKQRIIREYQLRGVLPEDVPDVPRQRARTRSRSSTER